MVYVHLCVCVCVRARVRVLGSLLCEAVLSVLDAVSKKRRLNNGAAANVSHIHANVSRLGQEIRQVCFPLGGPRFAAQRAEGALCAQDRVEGVGFAKGWGCMISSGRRV
jgi:hypothetical protein